MRLSLLNFLRTPDIRNRWLAGRNSRMFDHTSCGSCIKRTACAMLVKPFGRGLLRPCGHHSRIQATSPPLTSTSTTPAKPSHYALARFLRLPTSSSDHLPCNRYDAHWHSGQLTRQFKQVQTALIPARILTTRATHPSRARSRPVRGPRSTWLSFHAQHSSPSRYKEL